MMNAEELQKFCAPEDDVLHSAQKPWTRDGYTWATNGCILVRIPVLADVPENPSAPATAKLWYDVPEPKKWFPVPVAQMPEPVPCSWCDGSGKDPNDRRYKCEECEGTRKMPDTMSAAEVNGVSFALRFLALIQGWEISPTGPDKAAWIRNCEALGLLMLMRK